MHSDFVTNARFGVIELRILSFEMFDWSLEMCDIWTVWYVFIWFSIADVNQWPQWTVNCGEEYPTRIPFEFRYRLL